MDYELNGHHRQHSSIHPILDQILGGWSGVPKDTVYLLINKYGLPNEASSRRIIWYNNGPWKRTIVYLDTVPHNFPAPHLDHLAQTVDYKGPIPFFDELARFDGSLYLDRTAGEATAKCHEEAANFMALNLMHDIVTGRRTVEDARRFAAENAHRLQTQGQASPYQENILFPRQIDTADPDVRYF